MSELMRRGLRGGRFLLVFFLVLGGLLLLARGGGALYVDLLWFGEVGYLGPFLTRLSWEWGLRAFVAGITALLVLGNLRVVVGTLGGIQIRRRFGDLEITEQVPRRVLLWGATGASVLIGLWFAASVPPEAGTGALLLLNGPAVGLTDPVLGRDLGFYLFRLPVLSAAVTFALVLAFFLLAFCLATYAATGSVRWIRGRVQLDRTPRLHLAGLAAALLALLALRFLVSRYTLLLGGSSAVQGIVGYTDVEARLPALTALAVVALAAGAGILWGGIRGRGLPAAVGAVTLVLGGLGVGQIYPAIIQRIQVEPNELARETPFIQYNLAFTRMAFGLDALQRLRLPYRTPTARDLDPAMEQLRGLPVWTPQTLLTAHRQVEARFRYYDFHELAVDRYAGPEGPVPVGLAVRELEQGEIPEPSWQNLHLRERFVVGAGAVATALDRVTPDGRTVDLVSGLPPESLREAWVPPDLQLSRPSVFFGTRPQRYAVVNPSADAFLDPDGLEGRPGVDFPRGILLDGGIRRLAVASRFQDWNLLLASEVGEGSRLVYRRQVQERARALAPFLRFPGPPQPVVADGRIHWILDGFTTSSWFPLSAAFTLEPRRPVRYVRGSVKVTVDAVTGETRLFVMDPDDFLLQGYRRAFPGLFHDLDEMPVELQAHLRYPRELLSLQAEVLLRYHQETAPVFHGQQDLWALGTQFSQGATAVPYSPEYGIWSLPGETASEFLLSTLFVPAGRQNLAATLVARSDPGRYGELLLFDIPVEDQVAGPRQVEALVEQDPIISQQFSLWRQGGSQVWVGHLHLVPVEGTLLYLEPVFLAADFDAIPELRRFVASDGRRVVMGSSREEALRLLLDRPPLEEGEGRDPQPRPEGAATGIRSGEALLLLDEAERRLRAGDWSGFGRTLEDLRELLSLGGGQPPQRD